MTTEDTCVYSNSYNAASAPESIRSGQPSIFQKGVLTISEYLENKHVTNIAKLVGLTIFYHLLSETSLGNLDAFGLSTAVLMGTSRRKKTKIQRICEEVRHAYAEGDFDRFHTLLFENYREDFNFVEGLSLCDLEPRVGLDSLEEINRGRLVGSRDRTGEFGFVLGINEEIKQHYNSTSYIYAALLSERLSAHAALFITLLSLKLGDFVLISLALNQPRLYELEPRILDRLAFMFPDNSYRSKFFRKLNNITGYIFCLEDDEYRDGDGECFFTDTISAQLSRAWIQSKGIDSTRVTCLTKSGAEILLSEFAGFYDAVIAIAHQGVRHAGMLAYAGVPIFPIRIHHHNNEGFFKSLSGSSLQELYGKKILIVEDDIVSGNSLQLLADHFGLDFISQADLLLTNSMLYSRMAPQILNFRGMIFLQQVLQFWDTRSYIEMFRKFALRQKAYLQVAEEGGSLSQRQSAVEERVKKMLDDKGNQRMVSWSRRRSMKRALYHNIFQILRQPLEYGYACDNAHDAFDILERHINEIEELLNDHTQKTMIELRNKIDEVVKMMTSDVEHELTKLIPKDIDESARDLQAKMAAIMGRLKAFQALPEIGSYVSEFRLNMFRSLIRYRLEKIMELQLDRNHVLKAVSATMGYISGIFDYLETRYDNITTPFMDFSRAEAIRSLNYFMDEVIEMAPLLLTRELASSLFSEKTEDYYKRYFVGGVTVSLYARTA
ncbi:MAG: phosphoribosyltransferase [Pseudomonadota bacterium]